MKIDLEIEKIKKKQEYPYFEKSDSGLIRLFIYKNEAISIAYINSFNNDAVFGLPVIRAIPNEILHNPIIGFKKIEEERINLRSFKRKVARAKKPFIFRSTFKNANNWPCIYFPQQKYCLLLRGYSPFGGVGFESIGLSIFNDCNEIVIYSNPSIVLSGWYEY